MKALSFGESLVGPAKICTPYRTSEEAAEEAFPAEELPEELPTAELPAEELPEELPAVELPAEELPEEELPAEALPAAELPEELPVDELSEAAVSIDTLLSYPALYATKAL